MDQPQRPTQPVAAGVVTGFGVALALWCAAFLAHLPWIDLPGRVAGPLLLVVWLMAAIAAGRCLPRPRAALLGGAAGVVTALLCLLILGSALVEQPRGTDPAPGASGLRPGMLGYVPAFLALGAAIGALGAVLGSRFQRDERPGGPDWLFRLGVITALAVVPLLIVGGAVTSTESGMAISGWPRSDAANLFLYPLSLMADPKKFLEHSHRLFGSFLGVTTIALVIYAWATDRRPIVRATTAVLLVAVIVQGVLGGLRVLDNSKPAGMIHGIGAQCVWAFAVVIAALLSPAYRGASGARPKPGAHGLHVLTNALLVALFVQITLGAAYRHMKDVSAGATHALYTHAAFSIIVVILATATGARAAGLASDVSPFLRRLGKGLVHVTGLQFVLGVGALILVMISPQRGVPPPAPGGGPVETPLLEAIATVAHQANGALVFGGAALLWVWSRRLLAPPVEPGAGSNAPS